MTKYTELKAIRQLSKRGDSNSVVDLVENPNTNELLVRKIIFGIDQPLYQGIFTREVRALSKLNTCDNIVKIIGHRNLTYTNHTTNEKQKVGCIVLEFISGETLANTDILDLTTKEKFKIVKQLLSAIEIAHFNGIIHRDINPNNIMIDDNGDVKVIDFGICKIKEMVNNSTVYNMGTNMYSAPEVHMHSQNATEQSDLYSIGAVLYFLFTGEQPPNVCNFQTTIDRISGIDIELKPIIKKLVEVDPINRYKDVSELKNDLSNIFTRFLDVKYRVAISMDSFKFSKLKNINLIPSSATISDINIFLPKNFVDLYINQDNNYEFLGANYSLMCSYNSATNIFEVLDIKKIVPLEREKKKKKFCEVSAKLDFVNPRFIHKLSRNDNLEIKNIVDDYCQKYRSKHNVDAVYQSKYGAWRNLLTITKKSVEDSAIRYAYDSYDIKNNICSFHLKDGVFLGDIVFSKESKFSLEKETRGQKRLFYIGEYEVTQRLWDAVMHSNPSTTVGDHLPVHNISWEDCQLFIQKLNQVSGRNFRLPTEAEWEYAAKYDPVSGSYHKYAGGSSPSSYAWYTDNSQNALHSVGTKSANALGLYDMSGNVIEWCQDIYTNYGSGNPDLGKDERVLRGGYYGSASSAVKTTSRGSCNYTVKQPAFGLRLCLQ